MNPPSPPTEPDSEPPSLQELREQYEAGATVQELVDASGLPYGTLLNRLHEAGTVMRTSWQTRRLREDPQARARLAARLRVLYEEHGATLDELARKAGKSKPATRRLLVEAGAEVRTTQQTRAIRSAPSKAKRQKLALWLRKQYEADASVPDLAKACNFSVATVYRLLREARTPMRPQHRHGPAQQSRKQP
ncbi:helix-turn-helix domain containing protein [Streptomyces sp. NPDC048278]|uniref:helix-turn-helix domain-containing protein n=1 Tax=Streptomyces sp. NPDC048278 TaxID=3155809 RepID=UPI00341FCF5E